MPHNMINQDEPIAVQKQKIKDQMAGIVLKCWQDPKFKEELITNPKKVLESEGITVNPDIDYAFVADERPKMFYITDNDNVLDSPSRRSFFKSAG
ncbi:hypothetical protein, partial [Agaribacterium haliotis]|uniref:hypothetical protein n=1 Tax=Agaribacterium haliotis TaxID=2013869 RepID=UPI0011788810